MEAVFDSKSIDISWQREVHIRGREIGQREIVFKATTTDGHLMAVKMLEHIKDQDGLMWASIELQVMLTIAGHPNVVSLHEVLFLTGVWNQRE